MLHTIISCHSSTTAVGFPAAGCKCAYMLISSLFTISRTRARMLFMPWTQVRGSAAFRASVRPSARESWAVRRSAMAAAMEWKC